MSSGPPAPAPLVSGSPPAGTIVVKGHGWRFSVPLAALVGIASALGARLVSIEQRSRDQAEQIRELTRACGKQTP